ncbi:MAG: peptide-methionine (S)-S-oxide reductase MsrA [Clostridiales Family XIII bacterium]|jgi:peptide methionine sulfoxide reductase msrA/msrB|nr:peptide-methionine (S)-S-oxide reductase MsrA [Clostridiales Family XIII bacterium]
MIERQIYFAGGCFWGVEKYFSLIPGVLETQAGYANADISAPSYEAVCTGDTGAVEAVRVKYDSEQVSLTKLIDMYFKIIDPTSVNRQGNDVGTQYRTGIYYSNAGDLMIIELAVYMHARDLEKPLAVELKPLENFYTAEEYHQKYLDKNPQGYCHIPDSLFLEAAAQDVAKFPSGEELRKQMAEVLYNATHSER